MPYRQLPNTDATRYNALAAAVAKAGSVPDAERPYPADLHTRLVTLHGQFQTELGEAADALRDQTSATSQADLAFLALQMVISHFIQVLNMAIARGVLPRDERARYELDVSSAVVPDLKSRQDVLTWADRILRGEAARVSIGGEPLAWPSAAEVEAARDTFQGIDLDQSGKKTTYDSEQEDVAALRPAVDELIVDLWDTIEFTYRKDDSPSKRRKAREWGVVYVTRPGEEPDPEEGTPENPPAVQ